MTEGDEAAIQELEARWLDALLSGDAFALGAMLSDDFYAVLGAENGKLQLQSRTQFIQTLLDIDIRSMRTENSDLHIMNNIAVGNARRIREVGESRRLSEFNITTIYVRRGSEWLIASRHASRPEAITLPERLTAAEEDDGH